MADRIIWSNTANADVRSISRYIKKEWTQKSAAQFQDKLFKLVETLKENPERGRISQQSNNIRILKVDKHNFLLYESMDEVIHIHNVLPYNMDHSDDPRFKL